MTTIMHILHRSDCGREIFITKTDSNIEPVNGYRAFRQRCPGLKIFQVFARAGRIVVDGALPA